MDPVIDVCLNSLRKKGNKASQCFEALRRMADCGIIVRGEKLTKEAAEIAIALFISEEASLEIAKSATNG